MKKLVMFLLALTLINVATNAFAQDEDMGDEAPVVIDDSEDSGMDD